MPPKIAANLTIVTLQIKSCNAFVIQNFTNQPKMSIVGGRSKKVEPILFQLKAIQSFPFVFIATAIS